MDLAALWQFVRSIKRGNEHLMIACGGVGLAMATRPMQTMIFGRVPTSA